MLRQKGVVVSVLKFTWEHFKFVQENVRHFADESNIAPVLRLLHETEPLELDSLTNDLHIIPDGRSWSIN